MVKFIIPGFYEHTRVNLNLIRLLKEHPEMFRPKTEIYASYGNFQFCIFDGGRVFSNYEQATQEKVQSVAYAFEEMGVPIRFVFTNNQLQEKDYYDRFANMILEECQNGINEIVISDEKLEAFIRERYPQYKFISSTTKCLNKPELLRQELQKDNYFMVCLDYNLNKNMELLKSLTPEEKAKCEFLVNAICSPGCPIRKEHYRLNSIFSLEYGKRYSMEQCMIKDNCLSPQVLHQKNNLTPEEIYNIYEPMGFQYFKLEGRTWPDQDLAATYAYYMAQPGQEWNVLSQLLR